MRRLFRIDITKNDEDSVSKDELLVMIRAGASGGQFDETQARMVQKALKFDVLDAADIMVHRMDIQWLDITSTRDDLRQRMHTNKHSRLVVCRDHIDDVLGILYLQDLLKTWDDEKFQLESILRPVELVPENLNLNRILQRMRDAKTQLLLVSDEYGGTSGLVTLEDVVEEVFGELDDQLEADRPGIERLGPQKLSIRSDVRYDELLEFLERESVDEEPLTDTVAQIIADRLAKVPKLGDRVDDPLGTFRVENMARRRITRVALQLLEPSAVERDS